MQALILQNQKILKNVVAANVLKICTSTQFTQESLSFFQP